MGGRSARSSRLTAALTASRSYRTHSGRSLCNVCGSLAGNCVPSMALSKCVTKQGMAIVAAEGWGSCRGQRSTGASACEKSGAIRKPAL